MKHLYVAALAWFVLCGSAAAQDYPYTGQVMIFAGTFCPRDWAPTDGALLPIRYYNALFSLLGNRYGGDGTTTFALPNIQPLLTKNGAPLTQCIELLGLFPSRD